MKNLFKVKQGGVLGRNLKHQMKIKKIGIGLFSLIALLFVCTFVDAGITSTVKNGGLAATAATLAITPLAWIGEDKKFKKLSPDAISSLSEEDMKLYAKALNQYNEAKEEELKSKLEDLTKKGGDNSKEIAEIKEALAKITDENIKQLKEALKVQGGIIKELQDKGLQVTPTVKAQINEFFTKNHEKIKELKRTGSGSITLEIKAVDVIATTNATQPDGTPAIVGVQMAPPSNVNLRGVIIDGLVNVINTTLPAFPYTESQPKDGNYSFVSEKGTKPQIDLVIKTRYAEPVKVAAYEILTDESIKDIPGLMSIAENYLKAKHDLKRQNGILFGDGLSPNPKGATTYGRTFVAGAMALKVTNPTFMDVVNAAITDVFTTHNFQDEIPYLPSLVLVNPVDFYLELVSAKDGNGLPLYPSASLFNRVVIGNVTIIPFEDIPAGKIFIADMSKYNTTNYVGYTVTIGWINDNFIKNEFCMLGESRFHAFVKKLDEQAFIYDDIATIRTAIKKP